MFPRRLAPPRRTRLRLHAVAALVALALVPPAIRALPTPFPAADETDEQRPRTIPTDSVWDYLAERYDADGDGRVTRAEYDRSEQSFARLDRDEDGVLTAPEFAVDAGGGMNMQRMLAMMEERLATRLMADAFAADEQRDELRRAEIGESFARMDGDGDGVLTRDELDGDREQNARPRLDGMLSMALDGRSTFDVISAQADADGDGRLSADELLTWFDATDSNGDGIWSMQAAASSAPVAGRGRVGRGGRDQPGRGRGGREQGGAEPGDSDGTRPGRRGDAPGGPRDAARTREPGDLTGQIAPDFSLAPLHGGDRVTLSSYAGKKPVALIFGSYT